MTARRFPAPNWLVPLLALLLVGFVSTTLAQPVAPPQPSAEAADTESATESEPTIDFQELVRASGIIGGVILALSVAMLALIVEHTMSIQGSTILPSGLLEEVHADLKGGRMDDARKRARESRSFLGRLIDTGLGESDLGYAAVEKAVEDTAVAQTSRLYRKIEYLSIIGTIAPMLGLLGTVWGMIGAFLAFESKANPQVAELAPGITRALVTTLLGLGVAVPALAGYGIFRNRIEGLTDEATQLADHLFADLKRTEAKRRPTKRPGTRRAPDAERQP